MAQLSPVSQVTAALPVRLARWMKRWMKYFAQPKNELLFRKRRRPRDKGADFELCMKEFTEQFIDLTLARGKEHNHEAASAHVKPHVKAASAHVMESKPEVASSEIPDRGYRFRSDMEAAAFE